MLKRNDLVKQFELVVKQEIKNFNDDKLNTNLAINYLKKDIACLGERENRRNAKLDSEMTLLQSEFLNFRNGFIQFEEWSNSKVRDLCAKNEELLNELKNERCERQTLTEDIRSLENRVRGLVDCINECNDTINSLESQLNLELARLHKKMSLELKNGLEDIKSLPSEAEAVKRFIIKKMDAQEVDFSGLMRELEISKRTAHVMQKNIENIYNVIDRLKIKSSTNL